MIRATNVDPMMHRFDETATDEARKQEQRHKARLTVADAAFTVADCRDLLDKLGLLDGPR